MRLKASDALWLSPGFPRTLVGMLNLATSGPHPKLYPKRYIERQTAVLAALEQLGGPDAIEPVRRLLRRKDLEQIHAEAVRCIEALEARHHRTGETLLRAATAPGETTLLRPASGTTGTDPDLLLRAGKQPME